MTEAYHNEALRKQRIVDKKNAAMAKIKYGEVRTMLSDSSKLFYSFEIQKGILNFNRALSLSKDSKVRFCHQSA